MIHHFPMGVDMVKLIVIKYRWGGHLFILSAKGNQNPFLLGMNVMLKEVFAWSWCLINLDGKGRRCLMMTGWLFLTLNMLPIQYCFNLHFLKPKKYIYRQD